MVNPFLHKVAEAISLSFHEEGYIEGISDPALWDEFVKAARMAMKAMKDPPDEVLRIFLSEGWDAMIEAMIKEEIQCLPQPPA